MLGTLQGKRFLLVEDNAGIQGFVSAVTRLEGADIVAVSSGEEGLAILTDPAGFDLVLLDLNLPGIQGWDVLQQIAGIPGTPPVVVFSTHSDIPIRQRAAEMGAIGFIAKPVAARELTDRLETLLSQL
jgi:DNA-binding response OmpR family regulator